MTRRDRIPASVLFAIATAFGISSTIQAYWIARLAGDTAWTVSEASRLLVLNLVYWYVPALVAPIIIALAMRYRFGRVSWTRLAAVHVSGAITYVVLHEVVLAATHALLFPDGRVRQGCWTCIIRGTLQQMDWLLMTYFFFVGLAHALAYRRESEAQELNAAQLETRLVEAQLQSLQRQLRPHFLFNTLNTISSLMRADPDAADRMMDQLGDLLRMTLHTSGAEQVPLKEELEVLQKYLEIEQTRFGRRLDVQMRIAPDTLDALVPYLLLQPLAENAIRHGVAPHARPGRIGIDASRAGEDLVIEVHDSGDGALPEQLAQLNRGVGLTNTRARLQHLYQDRFDCAFSNTSDGFCVTVRVPFRQDADPGLDRQGAA